MSPSQGNDRPGDDQHDGIADEPAEDDPFIVIIDDETELGGAGTGEEREPGEPGESGAERAEREPEPRREAAELAGAGRAAAAFEETEEPASTEHLEQLEEELEEELSDEAGGDPMRVPLPWLFHSVAVLACAFVVVLLMIGWSYYQLPLSQRPFHHYHAALRPSGAIGLSVGLAGTIVMIASLAYLVRKRIGHREQLGPLQRWLGFHIFAGLLGAVMVVIHAAFVPYSAIGLLAFSAMLVVVGSGIVGRYIYIYFPRSLEGRELEFEDVRQRLVVYRKKLAELGIRPALLRIDAPSMKERSPWLIQAVIGVIYGDRESQREFLKLKETVSSREALREHSDEILLLARKLTRERQSLVRYQELRKLMGAWRFFHRWLAIVALFALFYHVAFAVNFGDLWILGGGG